MKTTMIRRFAKAVVLRGLQMLAVIWLILGELNCGTIDDSFASFHGITVIR
jgi:hypothetical protein